MVPDFTTQIWWRAPQRGPATRRPGADGAPAAAHSQQMHGAARRPVNRRVNRPVKPLTQGAEGEAEADVAGLGQHRGLAAVAQHTFHLGKHGLGEDLRASQKAGRGWVGGGGRC